MYQRYVAFLHNFEISIVTHILTGRYMSKFIRSLGLKVKTSTVEEKELQTKCTKCGKRTATGEDNLCDNCRFENVLARIVKEK